MLGQNKQKKMGQRKHSINTYRLKDTHSHTEKSHKNTNLEAIVYTQRTWRDAGLLGEEKEKNPYKALWDKEPPTMNLPTFQFWKLFASIQAVGPKGPMWTPKQSSLFPKLVAALYKLMAMFNAKVHNCTAHWTWKSLAGDCLELSPLLTMVKSTIRYSTHYKKKKK